MAEESLVVEFVVVGAPASIYWKYKKPQHRKNYKRWKQRVSSAAKSALASGFTPIRDGRMQVTILHFYQTDKRDIDNILKAILDGMGNAADPNEESDPPVVWHDDEIVERIIAERYDNMQSQFIEAPSALVLREREFKTPEFVYVRVDWLS